MIARGAIALDKNTHARGAIIIVPRNDIARVCRRPTDGIVGRIINSYTITDIRQNLSARDIYADKVALHEVAGRGWWHNSVERGEDEHASSFVTRNDVACASGRPADGVAGRACIEVDAARVITDGDSARNIRADEVALHEVDGGNRRHAGCEYVNAVRGVARKNIACGHRRPAN